MKKIIIGIIILTTSIPAFSQCFFEPEWKEFCPNRYSNIKTDKFYLTSEGRYWSNRRKIFEERMTKCQQLDNTNKNNCYENLRTLEQKATQTHNDDLKVKALRNFVINSY